MPREDNGDLKANCLKEQATEECLRRKESQERHNAPFFELEAGFGDPEGCDGE